MSLPAVTPDRTWFGNRLRRWFRAHRRDLPWRRSPDPYRVWISEMMLQQTRVATVEPYFERFVARFPTLRSLAVASSDEVLKHWEGLGYYRRARHIKQAAEQLVAAGVDTIPDDYERLLALPGVGRYTAGAVMSLAYGRPYPIQDGNVRRVLTRFWAVGGDVQSLAVQRWLWQAAEALIPRGHAAEFNEALMELGAIVCTDRGPECAGCPLRARCAALRRGDPSAFPRRRRRRPLPHVDVVAAIVRRGRRILITRRPETSMLGGLWEFPGGKVEPGERLEQTVHRELAEELAIRVRIERPFIAVDHAYSHFRITLHTFLCRHVGGTARSIGCSAWRWVEPSELERFAFPKADRVVLAELRRLLAPVPPPHHKKKTALSGPRGGTGQRRTPARP